MNQKRPYKRLPGRYRSSTGQRSLWLGADHLLAVDQVYFEEKYRRFYFSDVQALVVQSTNLWHLTTLIIAVLTLALLTPGYGERTVQLQRQMSGQPQMPIARCQRWFF